jgi:Tannase and feruloyl esterase
MSPLLGRLAAAAAGLVGLGVLAYVPTPTAAAGAAGVQPVESCQSLSTLRLPNTTVTSATAVAATSTVPAYCAVQLTVSNPPSNDAVHVGVFMPASSWNGRFEGVGGGGYSTGNPTVACSPFAPCPLRQGYASAATDGGHTVFDGSFALNPDGTLNWQLIDDFSFLGIHEMTVTAKSVISAFYGMGPRFAYFNGCSTGGRQGLMEAQRYPTDYNGIASGAPAINWTKFIPAELWGELEMNLAHDFIPQCKLAAADSAAIAACDGLDGVVDGIISDWQGCHFDARRLVGAATPCGTITATDADLINRIWQGPRDAGGNFLWFGLLPGASFAGLDGTVTAADGATGPVPFPISVQWFQDWLAQNPGLDWRTITFNQFLEFFQQSVSEFGFPIATDDPNLTGFRSAGGKIVIWHGTYDQLIFPEGTVNYYSRVVQTMGGPEQTDRFARLFVAPGAQHCTSAAGPAPADPLGAVVDWVEHHRAPDQLLGVKTDASGNVVMTRPICVFPLVARFKGHGNVNDASSFVCRRTFGSGDD